MHFPKITTIFVLSAMTIPVLAICSPTNQTTTCICSPGQPSTKYPDKCEITKVFDFLSQGNFTAFLARAAPNVSWTIMGTHPLAGNYHNRTIFAIDSLQRLSNTMDPAHPTMLDLTYIIGGGDEEWSVQELHGSGVCKNGLKYDNKFAWVTRWNTEGIIAEVRAYLDSALVHRAITENESEEYTYSDQRTKLMPGPVGSNCKA